MNTETIDIELSDSAVSDSRYALESMLKVSNGMLDRERSDVKAAITILHRHNNLHMTPQEADSIAYVLMTSLHIREVHFTANQRLSAAGTANRLFYSLGYNVRTNTIGSPVRD